MNNALMAIDSDIAELSAKLARLHQAREIIAGQAATAPATLSKVVAAETPKLTGAASPKKAAPRPAGTSPAPGTNADKIRRLLAERGPLSCQEIAAALGTVKPTTISGTLPAYPRLFRFDRHAGKWELIEFPTT